MKDVAQAILALIGAFVIFYAATQGGEIPRLFPEQKALTHD